MLLSISEELPAERCESIRESRHVHNLQQASSYLPPVPVKNL